MTVRCGVTSRDHLAFSKSILKRFICECVDRDAAVASPWIIRKEVAAKYDISLVMPDDICKDVDAVKKTETEKRQKISETRDKEAKRRATYVLLTEEKKSRDRARRRGTPREKGKG
jgi:bromodomain adjacent to zinc finger domain protein 1A